MEKDALIKIIIQDVKELDTLLNAFTGKSEISKMFIQLARNKTKGIIEEIDMLENLIDTNASTELEFSEQKITESKIIEQLKDVFKKPNETARKTVNENIIEIEQTVEKQETAIKTEINNKKPEPVTLGEKLMQGNQSFYDTLTQKKEQESIYQNRPIKDIMSAIGINDRFYFQKELFGGDTELFNSIISQLNSLNNMDMAEKLLAETLKCDENSEAVQLFKNIIRRRYL